MSALAKLFTINLLIASVTAHTQSVITSDFAEYHRQRLTEKIFVHTDKETYLSGETLWFSIYVVDGLIHHPLDLSKIAYVEVLDEKNRPLIQSKIPLTNGRGSGSLDIPDVVSARYTLRAYTRWMRNFGPDYFFEKEIVIINSFVPNVIQPGEATADHSKDITVRFFPEGGQLVQNIKSKVAFQTTDRHGKGIDVTGYITTDRGDTVAHFKTLKFGIGNFSFTPSASVNYEALVSYQGAITRHKLPLIYSTGYVLSVNTLANGRIHVVVSRGQMQGSDTVMLFVHTRHNIKLVQATTLKDGVGGFLIDHNKIGEGISHFTVFTGAGQPVCERLYFVRPKEQLLPQVRLMKNSFTTRELVRMNIHPGTTKSPGVASSLSVTVYKLDSMQFNLPLNIHHYLMLCSDLKGTVESPEYYFTSNDSLLNTAVDNLMLTHGWRRFTWTDVLERRSALPAFVPDYEGIVVSGTLMNRDSSAAINENAYLSFPGMRPQFFSAQSRINGRFEFMVKKPFGRKEGVIQAARNPEAYIVSLHTPFAAEYTSRKISGLQLPDQLKSAVIRNSIRSQAKSYFEKEPDVNETQVKTDPLFYINPDKVYKLDDYQRFPTLEDVMREYVREVTVVTKGKRSVPFVVNRNKEEYFSEDPLILVDGVPISSTYRVTGMAASGVESMEIVGQRYRLGPATFYGIISIKTQNGRLGGLEPEVGAYAFDFEGLDLAREFYSPVHPSSVEQDGRIPDFRTVLHWEPLLEAGSGENELSFYTSDETGSFIAVVQGVTADGIAGSGTFMFEVREH